MELDPPGRCPSIMLRVLGMFMVSCPRWRRAPLHGFFFQSEVNPDENNINILCATSGGLTLGHGTLEALLVAAVQEYTNVRYLFLKSKRKIWPRYEWFQHSGPFVIELNSLNRGYGARPPGRCHPLCWGFWGCSRSVIRGCRRAPLHGNVSQSEIIRMTTTSIFYAIRAVVWHWDMGLLRHW